jgi:hypothetical protein
MSFSVDRKSIKYIMWYRACIVFVFISYAMSFYFILIIFYFKSRVLLKRLEREKQKDDKEVNFSYYSYNQEKKLTCS